MPFYADAGVKELAVNDFIELVGKYNKSLGLRLKRYRKSIYREAITNIQSIGVHNYAERILDKKSRCRIGLESVIAEECIEREFR